MPDLLESSESDGKLSEQWEQEEYEQEEWQAEEWEEGLSEREEWQTPSTAKDRREKQRRLTSRSKSGVSHKLKSNERSGR